MGGQRADAKMAARERWKVVVREERGFARYLDKGRKQCLARLSGKVKQAKAARTEIAHRPTIMSWTLKEAYVVRHKVDDHRRRRMDATHEEG